MAFSPSPLQMGWWNHDFPLSCDKLSTDAIEYTPTQTPLLDPSNPHRIVRITLSILLIASGLLGVFEMKSFAKETKPTLDAAVDAAQNGNIVISPVLMREF